MWLDPRLLPRLRGRRVLLVDDVISTGSSALAGLAVLRAAGVAPVGLAVAMKQGDRWRAAWPAALPGRRGLRHTSVPPRRGGMVARLNRQALTKAGRVRSGSGPPSGGAGRAPQPPRTALAAARPRARKAPRRPPACAASTAASPQRRQPEIPADVGDDLRHRAVVDLVVELGPIQPVEQLDMQLPARILPVRPLGHVLDLAEDAPPRRGPMLVLARRGDGFAKRRARQMLRRTAREMRSNATVASAATRARRPARRRRPAPRPAGAPSAQGPRPCRSTRATPGDSAPNPALLIGLALLFGLRMVKRHEHNKNT